MIKSEDFLKAHFSETHHPEANSKDDKLFSWNEMQEVLEKYSKHGEEKEYVLVSLDTNYADEFDVYGYVILTKEESKEFVKTAKLIKSPFEIYFGTNEGLDFSNGEDFLTAVTFKDISGKEYEVLKNTTGAEYGWTSFYDYILEYNDEWEEI